MPRRATASILCLIRHWCGECLIIRERFSRFTGKDVPACGFSIGFERIILILTENGFKVPGQSKKKAYLVEKGISGEALCNVIAQAQKERQSGAQVLVARMNKNKKFQKEQLMAEGYEEFLDFYKEGLKN